MEELDDLGAELLRLAMSLRPEGSPVPLRRQVGAIAHVAVATDPVSLAGLSAALGIGTRSLLEEADRGELVIGTDGRTVAVPVSSARARLARDLTE